MTELSNSVASMNGLGPNRRVAVTFTDGRFEITPGGIMRGYRVGVSGDITLEDDAGNVVTMPAAAAGMWHPDFFVAILEAGTTATNIVVGY
ncbi:MAG: hypothetical protein AAGI03_01930 [Pseudomonadota bacterium]